MVAADGGAASGKTTGAKLISKKYGLKFLSSGLLYRYASYLILKHKPGNVNIFLKNQFKNLNLKKLDNKILHSPEISNHSSVIAKKKNHVESESFYHMHRGSLIMLSLMSAH